MSKSAPDHHKHPPKASPLDPLIERVNQFSADNYWDLGKFLVEKVIPAALNQGIFSDQILKRMSEIPGFKFPVQMLKHCQRFYTYYPDLDKRPLPEMFYFELATKVEESRARDRYEKMAIANKWTISDLQKRIRDDEQVRRQDERTRFGFDLKERNIWSFDAPDPRFGKAGYKGRIPGQVVANALFYYTRPGGHVLDPMAGSGTTGDVIQALPHFSDRRCTMYDIDPADERIRRANILQTGIPEQSASVDYVFLDPPHEFYPRGSEPEFSAAAAKSETLLKLKSLCRECVRVLKPGGRISIVAEASIGSFGIIDFPLEISLLMREMGMIPVGKVYLPRRGDMGKAPAQSSQEGLRSMQSDCRELLTFTREG